MYGATLGDRAQRSNPIFNIILQYGLVGQQLVDGAVAGNLAVSKIHKGDKLVSVIDISDGEDLTDEFTIVSDGVINNTGGTSSNTNDVLVTWEKWGTVEEMR